MKRAVCDNACVSCLAWNLPQDRIGRAMIDDAESKGLIQPGKVRAADGFGVAGAAPPHAALCHATSPAPLAGGIT